MHGHRALVASSDKYHVMVESIGHIHSLKALLLQYRSHVTV